MTTPLAIVKLNQMAEQVAIHGTPVHGADALGIGLHSNGNLGADILWVPATKRFPVHTHPGDHLLYCIAGTGTITVDEVTYDVEPGDLYMVDGRVPHAVGAGASDHVLMAIGSPHRPVDSTDRMAYTDWGGHPVVDPIFVDPA